MKKICLGKALQAALAGALVASPVFGHEPLDPGAVEAAKKDGTYSEKRSRVLRTLPHRLKNGLAAVAAYKLKKASLEAAGHSRAEVVKGLFSGPQLAFPFASPRELVSVGEVETLTLLIDFKDYRAETVSPTLTRERISENIYGAGTKTAKSFAPYESLRSYYRRASEGKLTVKGRVLGWHGLSKERARYEPRKANVNLPPTQRERLQAIYDQKALFAMVSEALEAHDATHDYSKYDNDNDGDLDLVKILYAGPHTGWGSFWWAYRWEFFIKEARKKLFDGKRVKQFVFQFVNTRGPDKDDFDPRVLLHEMGHAFGLADYYDYDSEKGPPGGVGGLDMMDANLGNHNAFSRWLLGWIEPTIVGSGRPVLRRLTASGSLHSASKAIAIFPGLARADAPASEMFIVENRHRTGNDGGASEMPGDGLLVWHVDASLNHAGDDFASDNSFTEHKLIRLLRADTKRDFRAGGRASKGTYFGKGSTLSPHNLAGKPSGVWLGRVSPPAEIVTLHIGLVSSLPNKAKASASKILPAEKHLDLLDLEQLDHECRRARPEELAKAWISTQRKEGMSPDARATSARIVLDHWAAKDGAGAMGAAMRLPEGLRARWARTAVAAWARASPIEAAEWLFAKERKLGAGVLTPEVVLSMFHEVAHSDHFLAVELLGRIKDPRIAWSALQAVRVSSRGVEGGESALLSTLRKSGNGPLVAPMFRAQQEYDKIPSDIRERLEAKPHRLHQHPHRYELPHHD